MEKPNVIRFRKKVHISGISWPVAKKKYQNSKSLPSTTNA